MLLQFEWNEAFVSCQVAVAIGQLQITLADVVFATAHFPERHLRGKKKKKTGPHCNTTLFLLNVCLFVSCSSANICIDYHGPVMSTCAHHGSDRAFLVGVQHRRQLGEGALPAFALGVLDFHGHVDGDPAQLVLDVFLR